MLSSIRGVIVDFVMAWFCDGPLETQRRRDAETAQRFYRVASGGLVTVVADTELAESAEILWNSLRRPGEEGMIMKGEIN